VERVAFNALTKNAASPPDICAFGDNFAIVFGKPIHRNKMLCVAKRLRIRTW
jgi:hypothetical protein